MKDLSVAILVIFLLGMGLSLPVKTIRIEGKNPKVIWCGESKPICNDTYFVGQGTFVYKKRAGEPNPLGSGRWIVSQTVTLGMMLVNPGKY